MEFQQTQESEGRAALRGMMFVLVFLPVLIFGPALGGVAAWLHSHGPSGAHVHLLATEPDHGDHGLLHDWHAAQHRHAEQDGSDEDEKPSVPPPKGLKLELPQILALAPSGQTSVPGSSLHGPALIPSPWWQLTLPEFRRRLDCCHSGWPPQGRKLSGIAALLRSSHAILI